jgi:hypothetical protein
MPKAPDIVKEALKSLSKAELEKLVLKAAVKSKPFHDYLLVTYAPDGMGVEDLLDQAKEKIRLAEFKNYVGRSYEKKQNRKLMAQAAFIAEFDKNCNQKEFTLELLLIIIHSQLNDPGIQFGTWYQAYDKKIASLLNRAIHLLQHKIHPDLVGNYKEEVNQYITLLKSKASHVDSVYGMDLI